MNNENWTPGPWEVRKWDGDEWPEKRISIAQEYGEALFINARYAKNVEANAQLIAAAPELYEALRECLEIFESLEQDLSIQNVSSHYTEDDVVMIRKALAKARGEDDDQ